jgi:hypothetical protein
MQSLPQTLGALFELIHLMTTIARAFGTAHENDKTILSMAITHADNLNTWLYGVKKGLIREKLYSVILDDKEVQEFYMIRHLQCITSAGHGNVRAGQGLIQGGGMQLDNAKVLCQLTSAISAQNKAATKTNNLQRNKIQCQLTRDENKKDNTKDIHPSILKMITEQQHQHQTTTKQLPATFKSFVNCKKWWNGPIRPSSSFKGLGFADVTFASGTAKALYIGEFLYSNSSIPRNFTVFAFYKQEPNSSARQQNYLICHLI